MSENWQKNLNQNNKKDQEEILKELDEMISSNNITLTDESLKLKDAKKGIKLPLIINIFAIAAVIITLIIANSFFKEKEKILDIQVKNYMSTEGRLLKELKKQTDEKLALKDKEIQTVLAKMEEINNQSLRLKANMDLEIANKKAELLAQMQRELEEERKKLIADGRSEEYIKQQLEIFSAQQKEELENKLAAFKNQAQELLDKKEAELENMRKLNKEMLAKMNNERELIEKETEQRERELTENGTQNDELSSIQKEMQELSQNKEREKLIIDQINASYQAIFDAMDAGELNKAFLLIESLEKLINDPEVIEIKSLSDRNNNDYNILLKLKQIIFDEQRKANIDDIAVAAELLLASRQIVKTGDDALNLNNFEEAKERYKESIKKLPIINEAYEKLNTISKTETTDEINELLSQANVLLNSGKTAAAIEVYTKAAFLDGTSNSNIHKKAVEQLLRTINSDYQLKIDKMKRNTDENLEKLKIESEELKVEIQALAMQNETLINEMSKERNNTLSNILSLTTELNKENTTDVEIKKEVEKYSTKDPLYSEVLNSISQLVEKRLPALHVVEDFKKSAFIGTVSHSSGGLITIEPIADRKLYKGEKIVIKRKGNQDREIIICNGTIEFADSSKIFAISDKTFSEKIQTMDMVYINLDE